VTELDQIYEINTHLLYELLWMIHAANAFENHTSTDPYVALLDSATVHGRNLFEFAGTPGTKFFTLASLGGTPKKSDDWDHWANNRVTHMLWREHDRAPWPQGLNNERDDRFMVMADAVLKRLEEGGASITSAAIKKAYDTMIKAAREYWKDPTEKLHGDLAKLYDDSRDSRPY
jgi:hypothetical protein